MLTRAYSARTKYDHPEVAPPPEQGTSDAAKDDAPDGPAYIRLVLLGILIGIPAALVAALFLALVHELQTLLWTDLPKDLGSSQPQWYLVLALPVAGGLIVAAARLLLPGDGGHDPLRGLNMTPTPLAYGPGIALAALGTLAFGPVLGPEAPLIALGSVVGMAVTTFVKLDAKGTAVIATAGSFSAISALFGGPLVAGVLMVEAGVGLGSALLPMLLPGLVAAATGYVLFVGLGSWGGLHQAGLVVPNLPLYKGTHLVDLLIGLGVGVVAALLMVLVRKLGAAVEALQPKKLPMLWLLVMGGAAVGLLALAAHGLGADTKDVLFSGQNNISVLVTGKSTKIVLVLLVAKLLGYAVTMGSGFRGGPVFPAIFIGVALAGTTVVAFGVSPTLAVAMGAAAGMAAMTRLLFAPLLLATLLVGTHGLDAMPAAVFASAGAWLTTTMFDRRAASGSQTARA